MHIDKDQIQDWVIALIISAVTILLNRITRFDKEQRDKDWQDFEAVPIETQGDIQKLLEISRMQSKIIEQLIQTQESQRVKQEGYTTKSTSETITINGVKTNDL